MATWLGSVRASSRFARFAAAISSTSADVANNIASGCAYVYFRMLTPPAAETTCTC